VHDACGPDQCHPAFLSSGVRAKAGRCPTFHSVLRSRWKSLSRERDERGLQSSRSDEKRQGEIQMAGMTEPIAPKQQAETRSAVERIGAFAAAARPEHLTADSRQLFKRNILDSIACGSVAPIATRPDRRLSFAGSLHVDWRRQDLSRSGGALQLRACAVCGSSR
jgi:hypothetical protein